LLSLEQSEISVGKQLIHKTPPLYHSSFPIVLFWSPKCGCTSLFKWFLFQIGHLEKALKYNPWVHKYRLDVLQADRSQSAYAGTVLNSGKDFMKLIRNPYERAVSSFYATVKNPYFLGGKKEHIAESGLSFIQFLYLLKEIFKEDSPVDGHLSRQVVKGEKALIKRYIRLEYFGATIKNIEKRYELLRSPIEQFRNSPHHHKSYMTNKGLNHNTVVRKIDFYNPKPLPAYESLYSSDAKKLVEELYAEDLMCYRYFEL
jgi:hypothetical protein